jgi:DNA-binding FadR family transcriptional regulator
VREALHVLTGEGLVEARSNGGFNLPFLDEIGLQDRYAWSGQILALAIHDWPRRRKEFPSPGDDHRSHPIAERAGKLFMAIARRSRNSEHVRAVGQLNSRMRRIRLAEDQVLDGLDADMEGMNRAFESGERVWMLRLVQAYHRKRHKMSADILRFTCNRP